MFNTLKKSALSTSIALSLLGLGSIAQVQAQDLPNIDPIEFDTFEGDFEGNPLFIDVGSDTSLLSISEWYQIQAYAQGAIGLPNTEPELRAVTRFPESDEFAPGQAGQDRPCRLRLLVCLRLLLSRRHRLGAAYSDQVKMR